MKIDTMPGSSMAEQGAVNSKVASSSLALAAHVTVW